MSIRPAIIGRHLARLGSWPTEFCLRMHRDERGAISVLSVFGIFLLTILLGQIMNTGRQIDDKLRMQNAADAAAYSGAVGIARGMNAIAFSNHVMCETFALVAYMREGRDRNSDQFIPPIIAAWQRAAEQFANGSQHPKFRGMGQTMLAKLPLEQEMATQFSNMAFHQSRVALPSLEYVLMGPNGNPRQPIPADPEGGFIPRFQRAVVQTTPYLSAMAADEIAQRYGTQTRNLHQNLPLKSLLWRTNAGVAGLSSEADPLTRTIPAVDPSPTGPDAGAAQLSAYTCLSRTRRSRLAHHYLGNWISHWQGPYFEWDGSGPRGHVTAKASNYINLYRVFACGQLEKLLNEEYPDTNLPSVLREIWRDPDPNNACGYMFPLPDPDRFQYVSAADEMMLLDRDYQFVSTAYWPQMTTMMPGLFQNPLQRNQPIYAVTFAQAEVYIPLRRYACCPWAWPVIRTDPNTGQTYTDYVLHLDNWPMEWDLFNQNWTVRLVPATTNRLPEILETHPQNYVSGLLANYQPPRLGVPIERFRVINNH